MPFEANFFFQNQNFLRVWYNCPKIFIGGDFVERLQKIIARAGVCSRREAEKLILDGRITVDGKIIRELGAKAAPNQKIRVDGKLLTLDTEKIYIW